MKQNGEAVKQAHGGVGASSHMACVLFSSSAGLKPTQVAYRGTGPAMNDLIGGHVDYFCEQAVSVTSQITSGTIKAYAVSSPQRLSTLPDVPTAKELGIDYDMSVWAGIFAPKGTPKDIVDTLATRSTSRSTILPCKSAWPISAARSRRRPSAHPPSSTPL